MRIETAKWRGERPPPSHIFQKAQTTSLLSARLFYLDKFLQNPLSNYREFCRSLSDKVGSFYGQSVSSSDFGEKSKNLFLPVGKWYAARAPPRKSEAGPNPIQIFGGKKMSKNTHLKIFQNFFQNHQVSLGVFLLGLFIGPERKGVSTWACTNAA